MMHNDLNLPIARGLLYFEYFTSENLLLTVTEKIHLLTFKKMWL